MQGGREHSSDVMIEHQIKSLLYSRCYAESCNELRSPSPRLSAWATQLRRNVAKVASRWRHCVDLTGLGIESQTSRTDSVRLATELTAGLMIERIFLNLFFVKHQNFFPQNSCVLPIKTIKTFHINCYIFCEFFVALWAVPYQGISEVRSPRSEWGEGGICRDPTILLY